MINKQTQNTSSHISVMLDEAITALNIKPDGRYVDATFGRGGHSSAILERLSEKGRLLAFDKDPEAVAFANKKFGNDVRFICHHGSYADMDIIVSKHEMMPSHWRAIWSFMGVRQIKFTARPFLICRVIMFTLCANPMV